MIIKSKDVFIKSTKAIMPLGGIITDLEGSNKAIEKQLDLNETALKMLELAIENGKEETKKLLAQRTYNSKIISNLSGMLNLGGM